MELRLNNIVFCIFISVLFSAFSLASAYLLSKLSSSYPQSNILTYLSSPFTFGINGGIISLFSSFYHGKSLSQR